MQVVFGTANSGKLKDVKKFMSGSAVDIVSPGDIGIEMPLIKEDGKSFEENAVIKYQALRPLVPGQYILAVEDSGLEVDALGGAPGVYSRRWEVGSKDKTDLGILNRMLDEMKNKTDRTARFVSVIAFGGPGHSMQTVRGELVGELLKKPDMDGFIEGLPYRALFYIPELDKMLYRVHDMPPDKRRGILTHREKVWLKLVEKIAS
jgi:XTP/dITP diphosphohydrolase